MTRPTLRAMLGAALLTCASVALPATADAQLRRIDVVENYFGAVYQHWLYDGGANWVPWVPVPAFSCGGISAYSIIRITALYWRLT